jgi:hypothetical protein
MSARVFMAATVLVAVAGLARAQVAPPVPGMNRWQEDWSVLADPAARTRPLDSLKFMPLGSEAWLSLGLTLRERYERNDAPGLGAAGQAADDYLLQRLQAHADLHLDAYWRAFAQFEDARAFDKASVSPVDKNPLDLRLAFLEYRAAGETFKARIGRQDFAFDLQRFVSSRDGPNVRQSFDAVWVDWETPDWRFIGFVSQPVEYQDAKPFDDRSGADFRFHTFRVERRVLGGDELSAYWSLYEHSSTRYGDASGRERRHVADARFAGKSGALDWDLEAMGQFGHVGGSTVRAWAVGAGTGWTLEDFSWMPRMGLQVDMASGDRHRGDGVLGTFNPLFPNGYYFSLAGYTGYVNLLQVKPQVTLHPSRSLSATLGAGLLWRQTTADAVYLQPNVPVAGTAGAPGRRTGTYWQARTDWRLDTNLTAAVELVHDDVSEVLRRAGAHDGDYVGVELKFSW